MADILGGAEASIPPLHQAGAAKTGQQSQEQAHTQDQHIFFQVRFDLRRRQDVHVEAAVILDRINLLDALDDALVEELAALDVGPPRLIFDLVQGAYLRLLLVVFEERGQGFVRSLVVIQLLLQELNL